MYPSNKVPKHSNSWFEQMLCLVNLILSVSNHRWKAVFYLDSFGDDALAPSWIIKCSQRAFSFWISCMKVHVHSDNNRLRGRRNSYTLIRTNGNSLECPFQDFFDEMPSSFSSLHVYNMWKNNKLRRLCRWTCCHGTYSNR